QTFRAPLVVERPPKKLLPVREQRQYGNAVQFLPVVQLRRGVRAERWACRRRPPASARASLPLPGAPEAQRSASMERSRSALHRLEERTMWYSAVGVIVTLVLSLLAAPLTSQAQPAAHVPRLGLLIPSAVS